MLSVPPKVSDFGFHVNSVSEQLHENHSEILGRVFFERALTCQQRRLRRDLGDRYSRLRRRASFTCPRCRGRHFIRKGRRWRLYTSTIGKTKLPIVQVQCRCCGARFCPYKDRIGLAFDQRISSGLKDRQLSITCQVPYGRARWCVDRCLGVSCSEATIRKHLDRAAEKIRRLRVGAAGEVVYQDSTKVKAGAKERGASVHLAITAQPKGPVSGRNQIHKRLLFLRTGSGHVVKESLKSLGAEAIVHDGDMDLSGCAPKLQRCLWHLPYQLQHFLWLDGMAWERRKRYIKELTGVLYKSSTTKKMEHRYEQFTKKLKGQNLKRSFIHLKRAQKELSTSRRYRFAYHTTSPAEREMREINRRADIGVRWSIPGVENLLLVKTWYRLNQPER
jgi:hypothetical protein